MYSAELLEEARKIIFHMLTKVVEYGGSDLFISADFPPSIKHQGSNETYWTTGIDGR